MNTKRVTLILYLVISAFSISFGQKKKEPVVTGVDISKDDKFILMACLHNKVGSVYVMNFKDFSSKKLIAGNPKISYFNPKYSPDGKRIVFIGYINQNVNNAAVYIANSDGTELKQITSGGEIINEALFSRFDSSIIIYSKANSYQSNSSIGVAQAHDMDLYSINFKNLKTVKFTNIKAYGIYSFSELDSSYFLMHIPGNMKSGMFIYNTNTTDLKRIEPANEPRKYPNMYYSPKFSKEFNALGFTGPYELYIMDLSTKNAKLVYRSKPELRQINSFSFFHMTQKILFKSASEGGLYSINFDGSDLKKIEIKLDD